MFFLELRRHASIKGTFNSRSSDVAAPSGPLEGGGFGGPPTLPARKVAQFWGSLSLSSQHFCNVDSKYLPL